MVTELNNTNFDSEVIKSTTPVVVDFWATWCGPCRMISPTIDKLAEQYKGKVKFCKVNVDENRELASRYHVMSIPLVLYFKGGKQADSSLGAVPESSLKSKIEALLA